MVAKLGAKMAWESGVPRCKVLRTGRMSSKAFLCGPEDCILSPGIKRNRKEYKTEGIIPWVGEPGGPQSRGSKRAGQHWGNLAHVYVYS